MKNKQYLAPTIGFFIIAVIFIWSSINPFEMNTWFMEVAPILIALPILFFTYKKFPLTNLLYALIVFHAIILMIGGHYTYARVPFFDMLWEGRNNYDKLGHFIQGFVPAMVMRELLLRTSPLQSGKWMFAIIVFSCLGISALYEIIEWSAALALKEGAEEFLGTQGDVWDTQKDMAWAGFGAIIALLGLSRIHNEALKRLKA